MKRNYLKKMISFALVIALLCSMLSGCEISNQHVEMHYEDNENSNINDWGDNENDNISDWDDANVVSWSDVDDYSNWVYAQILFDDITDQMPVVECRVIDYQKDGQYFDGDKVYELVGDKFDVNSFVSNYAVGTGVIVICVILTVATGGSSTPVACFIAGACDTSISMAVKGMAFGAATNGVMSAIKSGGDFEEALYGALEGSSEGYKWGAIYGAITGGFNSEYCFTGDTLVLTDFGLTPISELEIGNKVYSYNEQTETYSYNSITQINEATTDRTYQLIIDNEIIECTGAHPFLTTNGWKNAENLKSGDQLLSKENNIVIVSGIKEITHEDLVPTYNLCVANSHTYMVGCSNLIVHNNCKPNEKYANDTYKFPEGSTQAAKYPDGVPFNGDGYPVFDKYAKATVKFEYPSIEGKSAGTCLVGNCTSDFTMANKAAGFASTPSGYTWHHCEDMMTMQLVPQDVHSVVFGGAAHAGGESVLAAFWKTLTSATP